MILMIDMLDFHTDYELRDAIETASEDIEHCQEIINRSKIKLQEGLQDELRINACKRNIEINQDYIDKELNDIRIFNLELFKRHRQKTLKYLTTLSKDDIMDRMEETKKEIESNRYVLNCCRVDLKIQERYMTNLEQVLGQLKDDSND